MGERLNLPEGHGALRRRLIALALFASLMMGLSCLPFVKTMMLEDWMHHATITGAIGPAQGVAAKGPWDFFVFMEGDAPLAEKTRAFWFAHPSLNVAFWRPLSSLLISVDHAAFGPNPSAYFLHSLAWYAGLCTIVAVLFSRLLSKKRAVIATLLFAILGTHQEVVMWSAARNAIICGVFGGLALLAHLRFRQENWKTGRWLTPLLFAVAYAAGEAALSVFAFLIAFELAQSEPLARRLGALAPTLVVTVLWLGLYISQGYGASFSGEYISPISQPIRYLSALPERLGFTMSVLLIGTPAMTWLLAPGLRFVFAALGVFAFIGLLVPLRSSFQKLPDAENRALKWLLWGTLLSMLPQLAGALGPRSYLIPSVGAAAIIAHVLVHAWESGSRWAKAGAAALVVFHGALGLLMWPSMSMVYNKLTDLQQSNFEAMGLNKPGAEKRSFLVVSADPLSGYFIPMQFASQSGESLDYFRLLSVAETDHRLHRISERTFELETIEGSFMNTPTERMTRAPEDAFSLNDTVDLDDLKITIVHLSENGLPDRLRIELKRTALPELWACYDGKMKRVEEISIGDSTEIPFSPPL